MSSIRRYLPHLLVGLSISLIMVGAYIAVGFASLTTPKTIWSISPLTITFSASAAPAQGSAEDSFKCAPPVTDEIGLKTFLNTNKIVLETSKVFPFFPHCGPSFTTVTIVAYCLGTVSAASCRGTYIGSVQISEFSQYRTISPDLPVTIVVT